MKKEDRVIRSVEFSVFSHATEEEERVKRAVLNLLPEGVGEPLEERRLSGYYGDPITMITLKIQKRKPSTEAFRNIFRRLSSIDRQALIEGAEDRVDHAGRLYIRLDKQRAYQGRAVLNEADPIKMKVRFRLPHGADPVETVRGYLEELDEEDPGRE